ncbi:DUF2125 domain-containing protein [Asticcacaulis sp. SL142]|uniref:DUF2125 domain-containing protein n=1 Tax=Asticcacaulis sp. SL142 TaxID=2995155 RepID=UPI00226D320D|nr:DUF2125 domain-containing protein [Asticcacaulis sp. SL142]WAC49903.1 DUF2125 domain-containing protein [Asticcacaulis sp. SL142]
MTDDTLTAAETPKKAPTKWGLAWPFLIVLIALGLWSAYWIYMARQVESNLTAHREALIRAGYHVQYDPVSVRGYPFRMFMEFKKVEVVAPSGKGFAAPVIAAEANAYALDKWVMVAEKGLTLLRGRHEGLDLGQVTVTGDALRASVSGLSKPIYDLAIEGLNPVFVSSDPARPFALNGAERFEAYLRPNAKTADMADILVRLTGAKGDPLSLAGKIGQTKPFTLHWEASVNHLSQFKGVDWGQSVETWQKGGGALSGLKSSLKIEELNLFLESDLMSVDSNRRLNGQLKLEISGSGDPFGFLLSTGLIDAKYEPLARPLVGVRIVADKPVVMNFEFRDGGTYTGPLKVSDAPTVF